MKVKPADESARLDGGREPPAAAAMPGWRVAFLIVSFIMGTTADQFKFFLYCICVGKLS